MKDVVECHIGLGISDVSTRGIKKEPDPQKLPALLIWTKAL